MYFNCRSFEAIYLRTSIEQSMIKNEIADLRVGRIRLFFFNEMTKSAISADPCRVRCRAFDTRRYR